MIRSARHPHLTPSIEAEVYPQIPDYLQATAITLRVEGVSVTLLPDAGLRVGSLVVAGRELLVRENGHPATWGIFPMAPWAGRMANATFTDLAGASHNFPPTWGEHAFHGRLYQSAANEQSVAGDGRSAVMYATLDRAAGWPLTARAAVAAELSGNSTAGELTITLTVTAEIEQLVTAGWHPCFRRFLLDATRRNEVGAEGVLSFAPSGVLARDVAMPGLHRVDEVRPVADGGVAAPGAGATWDDPFVGVDAPPQISWGDDLTVMLAAGPAVTHWMVYDPDDALCVEPQAGPPDAFHRGGAIHLKAGESLVVPLTLRWTSKI
jgi:aldose 1-epimerase